MEADMDAGEEMNAPEETEGGPEVAGPVSGDQSAGMAGNVPGGAPGQI